MMGEIKLEEDQNKSATPEAETPNNQEEIVKTT